MNTNNSISNTLKRLLELNTNSLKTFERINEAVTTEQKSIPLEKYFESAKDEINALFLILLFIEG